MKPLTDIERLLVAKSAEQMVQVPPDGARVHRGVVPALGALKGAAQPTSTGPTF